MRWEMQCRNQTTSIMKNPNVNKKNGPALAFGAFSGHHGLGRAAAYDIEYIKQLHSDVITIDISDALLGRSVVQRKISQQIENIYLLCQPDTYWVIPKLIEPKSISNAYRMGRWVWETPVFPKQWVFATNIVHEILAPSQFCADTFATATCLPTSVVPYYVSEPPVSSVDFRQKLGIAPRAFLGVAIMDIVSCPDRKNPWAHVRAWKQAFNGDPSAILVMKIRVGKRTKVVIKELEEMRGGDKNIIFLCDDLSADEISALHRSADVFLSLHRSEGFGLNIYEALLLGKKVIATDYSANAEFGPGFNNYVGLPFKMKPYSDWLKHYSDQFLYADVDIDAAASSIRKARELNLPLVKNREYTQS